MSEQNEIEYSLTINTEHAQTSVRKFEITIIRCLGYASQLAGGDSDIQRGMQKSINIAQDAVITYRSATIAARAFQAASGPVGWLYFGTTVLAAGISYSHMMTEIGE